MSISRDVVGRVGANAFRRSPLIALQGSKMATPLPKARRELLIEMESILGNECYNANIENYGPGGVREAPGRAFRYPITLRDSDGTKSKLRSHAIYSFVSDDAVRSGYYAFGANQLDVMNGLEKILQLLENQYGFRLPQ